MSRNINNSDSREKLNKQEINNLVFNNIFIVSNISNDRSIKNGLVQKGIHLKYPALSYFINLFVENYDILNSQYRLLLKKDDLKRNDMEFVSKVEGISGFLFNDQNAGGVCYTNYLLYLQKYVIGNLLKNTVVYDLDDLMGKLEVKLGEESFYFQPLDYGVMLNHFDEITIKTASGIHEFFESVLNDNSNFLLRQKLQGEFLEKLGLNNDDQTSILKDVYTKNRENTKDYLQNFIDKHSRLNNQLHEIDCKNTHVILSDQIKVNLLEILLSQIPSKTPKGINELYQRITNFKKNLNLEFLVNPLLVKLASDKSKYEENIRKKINLKENEENLKQLLRDNEFQTKYQLNKMQLKQYIQDYGPIFKAYFSMLDNIFLTPFSNEILEVKNLTKELENISLYLKNFDTVCDTNGLGKYFEHSKMFDVVNNYLKQKEIYYDILDLFTKGENIKGYLLLLDYRFKYPQNTLVSLIEKMMNKDKVIHGHIESIFEKMRDFQDVSHEYQNLKNMANFIKSNHKDLLNIYPQLQDIIDSYQYLSKFLGDETDVLKLGISDNLSHDKLYNTKSLFLSNSMKSFFQAFEKLLEDATGGCICSKGLLIGLKKYSFINTNFGEYINTLDPNLTNVTPDSGVLSDLDILNKYYSKHDAKTFIKNIIKNEFMSKRELIGNELVVMLQQLDNCIKNKDLIGLNMGMRRLCKLKNNSLLIEISQMINVKGINDIYFSSLFWMQEKNIDIEVLEFVMDLLFVRKQIKTLLLDKHLLEKLINKVESVNGEKTNIRYLYELCLKYNNFEVFVGKFHTFLITGNKEDLFKNII